MEKNLMLMREEQRLIGVLMKGTRMVNVFITWGKCGPSGAPAEPFLPSFGFRVACFCLLLGQSHFYVFVCCLSTLSLHWAVPQISFVFCFLSSCGLCLCSWLLQLPLLVFFCQRDIQSVFFVTERFLPTSLHCISENWGQLWNIFNIDNRLESSQMWIYLQKLVAWADLPGKVGRD